MIYDQVSEIQVFQGIDKRKIICLDTETTGFSPREDEILQLSIMNGCGDILFDEYVKPQRKAEWPCAQAVHGISPEMVGNNNSIEMYQEKINQILAGAELCVGYNLSFDLNFLRGAGVCIPEKLKIHDVMWAFSKITGKRRSLSYCAAYYGYSFQAHDSLEDAKATLHCFFAMNKLI